MRYSQYGGIPTIFFMCFKGVVSTHRPLTITPKETPLSFPDRTGRGLEGKLFLDRPEEVRG